MPVHTLSSQIQTHGLATEDDLDALLHAVGNARILMLGEASHGTHEYYTWRARISKRLIEEKGFRFIAVEGDWPPCYQLNRYIKQYANSSQNVKEVLRAFERWPGWMWANYETAALLHWLKRYNSRQDILQRVGFYGLDVYSLWESLEAIVGYLEKEDPEAAVLARESSRCFEPYRNNEQQYAWAAQLVPASCEAAVLSLLQEISSRIFAYDSDPEAPFSAEQNALVAVNAEKYYRAMIKPGPDSWNVRDRHMMATLERLLKHHGERSKAIVWAHNTHIGDARYTDMRQAGMLNLGQLARERFGEEQVKLVGFGSYGGTVLAGSSWGAQQQVMEMPNARKGSWEHSLHQLKGGNYYLLFDQLRESLSPADTFDHRAIGVVYHPDREQYGNYVPSQIAGRYDAFVYLDRSRALHPLHTEGQPQRSPETYPWGV